LIIKKKNSRNSQPEIAETCQIALYRLNWLNKQEHKLDGSNGDHNNNIDNLKSYTTIGSSTIVDNNNKYK